MAESDEDHVTEEPPPLPLWQEIQKRTFTNWVNLRLSPSFINDLVGHFFLFFSENKHCLHPFSLWT